MYDGDETSIKLEPLDACDGLGRVAERESNACSATLEPGQILRSLLEKRSICLTGTVWSPFTVSPVKQGVGVDGTGPQDACSSDEQAEQTLQQKEERQMEEDPACSYNTESSPDAAVKQEIDVGPTVLQPTDLRYMMTEPKLERSNEGTAQLEEDSILFIDVESPDAVCAVEEEVDIGPTVLQPSDRLQRVSMIKEPPKFSCSEEGSSRNAVDRHAIVGGFKIMKEQGSDFITVMAEYCDFRCDVCGTAFKTKHKLKAHMTMTHNAYECNTCKKFYKVELYLSNHEEMHWKEKRTRITCTCTKDFSQNSKLEAHVTYKCYTCKFFFKSQSDFSYHNSMSCKPTIRNYKCSICTKVFIKLSKLETHLIKQHNVHAYECDICGKSFTRKFYFSNHKKNAKCAYKCYVCSKIFTRKSEFNTHIYDHTSYYVFKCSMCKKVFQSKIRLTKHMAKHSDDYNTFKCSMCENVFRSKSGFTNHTTRHSDDYNTFYKCDTCLRVSCKSVT